MKTEGSKQHQLYRTDSGRWCLNGIDLTCGSCVEVNIEGHWIEVGIEHDQHDYYAIPTSIRLQKGMVARFIEN